MTERQGGEQTGWKRTALTSYRDVGNLPVQKGRKKLLINCYLVAKSCPTPSDPMDWSSPGSSVHGIPQQESWSGLPFPSPRDLPNPEIEPASSTLAGSFFTTELPRKIYLIPKVPGEIYQVLLAPDRAPVTTALAKRKPLGIGEF